MKLAPVMRNGGYLTMQRSDAETILKRLQAHFRCNAIRIEKAPIDGEHNWIVFEVPPKMHESTRVYIEAYEQGGRDKADRLNGRAYQPERNDGA